MSRYFSYALDDLTATGASSAASVEALDVVCVAVTGTFTATYSIEGSIDGTNFAAASDIHGNSLAGLTAPTAVQMPAGYKQLRVNCTAFTSGTIESDVGGKDDDLRG